MPYPYRLNPWEQSTLDSLMTGLNAGMDPQLALQYFQGTIDSATQRRQERLGMRREGLMGLRELATQYAAQGAAPEAVSGMVTGMASDLPLMNGPRAERRIGGLEDYVQGLYQGGVESPVGTVSGLAPLDARMAFASSPLIDEEDRAILGQTVMEQFQAGIPFKDIRNVVSQTGIAAGYSPEQLDAAMTEAERIYEELSGVQLEDIRGLGDFFRGQQAAPGDWEMPGATGVNGEVSGDELYQQWLQAGGREYDSDNMDITGLLGWMASQRPEMLQSWTTHWPGLPGGAQPYQEPSVAEAFSPSSWFFQG